MERKTYMVRNRPRAGTGTVKKSAPLWGPAKLGALLAQSLLLTFSVTGTALPDDAPGDGTFACLSGGYVIVELATGKRTEPGQLQTMGLFRSAQSLSDRVAIDSRGRAWSPVLDNRSYFALMQISYTATDICWAGGFIHGAPDTNESGFTIGRQADFAKFILSGTRLHELPVAIEITQRVDHAIIKDSWFSSASKCIVTDNIAELQIEDSLLEDCPYPIYLLPSEQSDEEDAWVIRDSLFEVTGNADQSGDEVRLASIVRISNSIFAVDETGIDYVNRLAEAAEECEDNTIVWLGEGSYPGTSHDCFREELDQNVWEEERSRWISSHPDVMRVSHGGDPGDDGSGDDGSGDDGSGDDGSGDDGSGDDGSGDDGSGDGEICFDGDCDSNDDEPWADGTRWLDATGWIE